MTNIISGIPSHPRSGSKRTRYVHPRFWANFYKHDTDQPISTDSVQLSPGTVKRGSSDALTCAVSKDIASPAGSFSITLVPERTDYFEALDPGDWCELVVDNDDGGGPRAFFYGPVKNIHQNTATNQSGAVVERIVVSGQDFGAAIANTTAIRDAKLAQDPVYTNLGLAKVVNDLKAVGGKPNEIVRSILDAYLFSIRQHVDPKTKSTFGTTSSGLFALDLDYLEEPIVDASAVFEPILLSNSLWQLLQQWANISLMELFIDFRPPYTDQTNLKDLTPAVVLRTFPFYGTLWDELPVVRVERDEVITSSFVKTDTNVKNWIRALDEPRITGVKGSMQVYLDKAGTANEKSIEKFGFRRHELATQYIFEGLSRTSDSTKPSKPIPDILRVYSSLQTLWHHSNERLLSGSLTTYFRPDVRVGYKLSFADREAGKELEFYVERVQHSINYPGRSTTTIGVTRGRDPEDERFKLSIAELLDQDIVQELGNTIDRVRGALGS